MADSFLEVRTAWCGPILQALLLSCKDLHSALFLNVTLTYCLSGPYVIYGKSRLLTYL